MAKSLLVAAFQEPANGTEAKPFKLKLERLPLGCRTCHSIRRYAYTHRIYIYTAAFAVLAAIGRTTLLPCSNHFSRRKAMPAFYTNP
jgi:hypothetical protein